VVYALVLLWMVCMMDSDSQARTSFHHFELPAEHHQMAWNQMELDLVFWYR
jgi:hypothetical protein